MAEKDKDAKPAAKPEGDAAPPAKKGLPVKTIGVVAVLMVAEAAAVFMIVGMTSKKPEAAHAEIAEGPHEDQNASVEVPLIEERFQNMQSGGVWIWDTEIVLKVRAKDEQAVRDTLQKRAAEVKEGISLIFRRAPHAHLKEPGLETINRQLTSYLEEVLGHDGEGHSRLQRVVVPKCKGFPAD